MDPEERDLFLPEPANGGIVAVYEVVNLLAWLGLVVLAGWGAWALWRRVQ